MEAKRAAGEDVEHASAALEPESARSGAPARAAHPEPGGVVGEAAPPVEPVRAAPPQAEATEEPAARRGVSPIAVVALVLLAATLAVGGFLGWQVYGTTWLARSAAADAVAGLRAEWAAAPAPEEGERPTETVPTAGEAAWILRIPSHGVEWPIASGVEHDVLTRAVGWYPSTALPGQVGNVALAGLRLTHGAPFGGLLELEEGDEVVIETPLAVYTYRITLPPSQLTVHQDDSWVLDPVPGKPDLAPTEAILTLTTHEDLIDTPDRAVGFGVLDTTEQT